MTGPGSALRQVRVSRRAAERWEKGHPWIFASDVQVESGGPGVVRVIGPNGKPLGQALYSPASEIRLRLLERKVDTPIDAAWWQDRLTFCLRRRDGVDATAYRVVNGEGDGLPSLIVDRYDRWVVAQLLSAGLETERPAILAAIDAVLQPAGILLRHDVSVRRHEGLTQAVELAAGAVPADVEVREGAVRYLAALQTGQKTGAFLDQRMNRLKGGALMPEGGRGLDCFCYHGSFALHLAQRAAAVVALDSSAEALARGRSNAALNGFQNIDWREVDAFEALRTMERAREQFDVVVIDPPAFAKTKAVVRQALKGYKEVNLRGLRLVRPGGWLVSASCSYHVRWPEFLAMIADAAADSGRRVTMVEHLTQAPDHPEVVSVPETGYLKGVVLRVD